MRQSIKGVILPHPRGESDITGGRVHLDFPDRQNIERTDFLDLMSDFIAGTLCTQSFNIYFEYTFLYLSIFINRSAGH